MSNGELRAAIEKLPRLDLNWPDEMQSQWWTWLELLASRIFKQPEEQP